MSEAPPSEMPAEAVGKAEEPALEEVAAAETLSTGDGEKEQSLDPNNGVPSGEGGKETLDRAAELFDNGSKAIEDGDFVEAVDCLSRALEIRVAHHGELAPECAISYYKYGCALLCKAQEEADPLVDVPKNTPKSTGKDKTLTSVDESGSSRTSLSGTNQNASITIKEVEDDGSDKDKEDDNEESDDDNEESAEAEEEDSDLDMAWKMLELARAIAEKRPEDTMDKVNILAALGEVSAEREDVETSLNDYLKALSILERLVEPDNRRIVELNFRICLVLEVGSKIQEAIPYCQKAMLLCNSRLQRLSDGSASPGLKDEIELLRDILSELERKREDLQQSLLNPKPVLSEVMNMLKSKSAETTSSSSEARSLSLSSSQMGVINAGGFDSPTVSTAATNGGVTHLGIVGRGIKRATVNPTGAETPPKKPSMDTSSEKDESSVSEVTNCD